MTTTTYRSTGPVAARRGGFSLAGVGAWLRRASERQSARHALARMDDRLLADIGLTREQAMYEASKAFWQR